MERSLLDRRFSGMEVLGTDLVELLVPTASRTPQFFSRLQSARHGARHLILGTENLPASDVVIPIISALSFVNGLCLRHEHIVIALLLVIDNYACYYVLATLLSLARCSPIRTVDTYSNNI